MTTVREDSAVKNLKNSSVFLVLALLCLVVF